jgi:hypothetical protein
MEAHLRARHALEHEIELLEIAFRLLTRTDLFPRHSYDSHAKEHAVDGIQDMISTRKKMLKENWEEKRGKD